MTAQPVRTVTDAIDSASARLPSAIERAGHGPQLIAERGVYTVIWHSPEQVQFEFDLLRTDRRTGTMTAEVTVWTHWPVTDYIHSAQLNLSSTQARTTLAKHLAVRVKDRELDWPALVETAVVKVRNAYRAGEPAILLRDAPEPSLSGAILPPIVASEGATLWHGDGGTGKSELALAAACAIHTGRSDVLASLQPAVILRTAFLDWEWTASVHRRRLARLWPDAELPDLVYVRCALPLAQDVERLRRMVREHGIQFVVIDSVALAAGGDPERAETAIEFYGGLRQLEVDALLVAHVTKQSDGEKPFGSTFWHNSARSTWYVRKAQDVGSSSLRVAMVNKKANDAPLSLPLGLEIDHGPESTVIRRTDLAAEPDLAREIPLRLRIKEALLGGSLSYAELAQQLEAEPDSIRRTVTRHVGKSFTTWTDAGVLRVECWPMTDRTPVPDTPDTCPPDNRTGHTAPIRCSVRPSLSDRAYGRSPCRCNLCESAKTFLAGSWLAVAEREPPKIHGPYPDGGRNRADLHRSRPRSRDTHTYKELRP